MTENEGAAGCDGGGAIFGGGSISMDLVLTCLTYFSLAGTNDLGLILDSGGAMPRYVV